MRAFAMAVVGVCASAGVSRSQPAAPPGPPDAAAGTAPGLQEADPVWQAYDDAFAQAAAGDRSGASARLRRLAAEWPQHPAAARASALVREAEPRPAGPDAP